MERVKGRLADHVVTPERALLTRGVEAEDWCVGVRAKPRLVASLARAGEVRLQAGMPADVYIKGEERTPLQYLVEPVTQVLRRAGRER